MNSQYSREKAYSSLQPKFKDCTLDASQGNEALLPWISLLGGVTRNISDGLGLENFLDHYLEREHLSEKTRPKFLDDEALSLDHIDDVTMSQHGRSGADSLGTQDTWSQQSRPSAAESSGSADVIRRHLAEDEADAEEAPDGLEDDESGNAKSEAEQRHMKTIYPKRYADLSEASQALDRTLFFTISTMVKGSFLSLIQDLKGKNARYTFAIIALWKHAELGSSSRRLMSSYD